MGRHNKILTMKLSLKVYNTWGIYTGIYNGTYTGTYMGTYTGIYTGICTGRL